jgi:hypothetical protein
VHSTFPAELAQIRAVAVANHEAEVARVTWAANMVRAREVHAFVAEHLKRSRKTTRTWIYLKVKGAKGPAVTLTAADELYSGHQEALTGEGTTFTYPAELHKQMDAIQLALLSTIIGRNDWTDSASAAAAPAPDISSSDVNFFTKNNNTT